jgi:hypothetical protein
MEAHDLTHFDEHRRANRVDWERPVRIVKPVMLTGKAVNVSAVGLLMRVKRGYALRQGDVVALEIPRADGEAVVTRRGRVVRLEFQASETLLGVELV